VARYQRKVSRIYLRADAAFAMPEVYEFLEAQRIKYAIRMRPDASENSQINPSPSFGLRELLVASHISRLASRDAAKSLLSTLVSESSGECRIR
jgi:hypothetical protein